MKYIKLFENIDLFQNWKDSDDYITPSVSLVESEGIKYNPIDNTIKVYAVDSNFNLVDYTTADSSCVGVAVVAGNHKFMIAKEDGNGSAYSAYWSKNLCDKDIAGIVTIETDHGLLGSKLSTDFTTWTEGGLSDFDGSSNTTALINAYAEHGVIMNSDDMCSRLKSFNTTTDGSNANKNDWYIPACGQLALIYLGMSDINAALIKIGGKELYEDYYWSSSECSSSEGWTIDFRDGYVGRYGDYKDRKFRVRFIRNI
jgi:hypothetical protein